MQNDFVIQVLQNSPPAARSHDIMYYLTRPRVRAFSLETWPECM